tara:strand:- start:3213 stop:4091 length:879 start_codon:yes stop_codon:yes gene_type:complete
MEKQEINLIDFYLLLYSKRYYFLLSILIGLLVTFGYYFLYNQKYHKSQVFIYHYTEVDFKKWALNNSEFFNEYFYFNENQEEASMNDVDSTDVFFEFTRLLDTTDLLTKYLSKYDYNLNDELNLENIDEDSIKYLKKILKNIKIKNIIENKEMLLEINSKSKNDVINIFKLLKQIQNILYLEREQLTLKEYEHQHALFEFRAMEKYFEETDYTSEKTKEYIEWTRTFSSNKVINLDRGEFELIYFDLNENDIRYVDSVNLLIVSIISLSSFLLIFLFYFLLSSAMKQGIEKK